MFVTATSEQRLFGAAELEKDERLRILLVAGGIVLALAVAVVVLRLYRLSELLPWLQFDEEANGVSALQVLRGEHAFVFRPDADGREGMIAYAIAMAASLLGRTVLAVRLPTALASAGTVFVVFWLGWLLFGRDESGRATPWRGLFIGGVGAGLLAVSLGQTIIGRTAFRHNFVPLLLSLCLALLWWGWGQRVRRGGTWWRIALAGVCAGLLAYTYIAARFTPLLFLFFGLSFLLPIGRSEDKGARSQRSTLSLSFSFLTSRLQSGPLKRNLPWAGLFVGMAGLVAAPILVHFALHPDHFFVRTKQLWLFDPSLSQGDPLGALLKNAWIYLLAFGFSGDPNRLFNFAARPMLNPLEAFFFWLGVGMAVWRWHRPSCRLLLLWLGVMLLPAMLTREITPPPNTIRMIGAVPAIYLLAAVGLWEAFRFLLDRSRALRWRSHPVFRADDTMAAIVAGVVAGGLVLGQGVITHRTYFQRWVPIARKIDRLEWTQLRELTQVVSAQPIEADVAYLIPSMYRWHINFGFLDQIPAPTHAVYMDAPDLKQSIQSTLAAVEDVPTVKVVAWNSDPVFYYETERSLLLLSKYGRYLGSDEYTNFQIHNYTDIVLDRPWTFYEELEPLTVHYDGGISLQGIALGQGAEQLSWQQQLDVGRARSSWVVLQWQTASELDIDYSISLRLYNPEGGGVYQKDTRLEITNRRRTSRWLMDELPVDTVHLLDLPADLPPGDYELRLAVYNSETQEPTVELGVWEPEVTVAHLRLAEAQ